VGITASNNLEDEQLGFANRVYRFVYHARQPLKRLKRRNRPAYYALRWGAVAGALYLLVFAGSGLLR